MAIERLSDIHAALRIEKRMGLRRQAYVEHMTFGRNHSPVFTEIFGPLVGLKEEWAAQGASPAELDFSAFRYRQPLLHGVAVHAGYHGGRPEEILEETDEHVIARDSRGRRVKLCKGAASLALPLEYPVRTRDDWLRVKPHYEFSEERFSPGWAERARRAAEEGYVVCVAMPGGFDEPRQLMGDAAVCVAYYEQPELIREMLDVMGATAERVVERVASAVTVDMLTVHEDMAGRSGPLAGPRQVREFIAPYYRRVWDAARRHGVPLFGQDSDGDIRPVIPAFLEAGLNVIWPCEPAAGMDIVQIRQQYGGRLALVGGLDKHVLRRSRAEIVAELEYKIPPLVRTGGCMLGLDHRIPNGTPLAHYRFYIETAWRIMEREAAKLRQ